uniref:hypothetical protein n=1 Tax=Rickettsia endosymbiont of Ixodes pacificus TaxID=1133329 RepID=UPI00067A5055|nr:hypothetical protein [Rickettsia endosymbiont of Ixodes pacificus]AKS10313.1 hypothetical protein REIP_p055 [Rickettsia endosymbiont of Ixodes pacificus]
MILKSGRPSNIRERNLIKIQENEQSINMTLNVSKDFHKQVKLAALEQDTTIKDIIIKAVKQYLLKNVNT